MFEAYMGISHELFVILIEWICLEYWLNWNVVREVILLEHKNQSSKNYNGLGKRQYLDLTGWLIESISQRIFLEGDLWKQI